MAKRDRQQPAGGAFGLLEEAVGLLRRSRAGTLGCYYIGTLPFVLVLLYFLIDVTQSGRASETLVQGAGGVAAAFIWMKCWHAVFAGRLMEELCGEAPAGWGPGRICRIIAMQAAIQPWGLILLPLAAIMVLPFPWAYGFFQNACVYGDGRTDRPGPKPLTAAWRQAKTWPGQNVAGLIILFVFAMFVLFNIGHAITTSAYLGKAFFDIDTTLTRGGFSVLNTTFLTIVFALGYLCLDPLCKAFYTLRCFYGQSLQTGQDLRSELRALIAAGCLVICLVLIGSAGEARAQTAPPTIAQSVSPQANTQISPEDLDNSLDDVISRRRYDWRRPQAPEETSEDKSLASKMLDTVWGWIKGALNWVWDMLKKIWDFLFPSPDKDGDPTGVDNYGGGESKGRALRGESQWVGLLRYLVYASLAGVVILLIVVFWKKLKLSQSREIIAPTVDLPPIDLEDDNVTADDLPESGWIDLARRLMAEGNARLALRAMYLASLAMLADKSRISIAKFKSNLDYQRELARRCHSMPQLLDAFGRNVSVFEAVWYGTRQATEQIINTFIDNQRTIGQMVADA
ncbi:MAG: DUF4129 domain-containing protein [Phycisphaerae bacterium]|jgi:hypothetical protein|nr:DUF4129 domain-containing protein [Phycisphaerae bacterium]